MFVSPLKKALLDRWGFWALLGVGVGAVSAAKVVRRKEPTLHTDQIMDACRKAAAELEERLTTPIRVRS